MKKWRRVIGRYLPILIITLVIGVAGYSWNAKTVGNNQMPMPLGFGVSVVLSGSMEPTLHINDLVIVKPADSYEPGDIVVYQTGNILVIHRLTETDGTTAVTKGDANNVADEPIPTYSIKGKLAGTVRGAGAVIQILQSTPGVVAILAIAVFFMLRSHRNEEAAADAETEQIRQEIEKLKAEMLSAERKENEHSEPQGGDKP